MGMERIPRLANWLKMNYRILLLILITVLAMMACTAVEGKYDSAQQTEVLPAVSATPQAAVAEPTAAVMEQDLERAEMQKAEPEPTQALALAKASPLPVIGPAPAWENVVWINSDGPLPLEALRGKVVLLEFWTFG